MTAAIVAFLCGVAWLQFAPTLPDPRWLWLGVPAAGLAIPALIRRWQSLPSGVLVLACAATLGFVWALGAAHWRMAGQLSPLLEGRDLVLTGVVASLPAQGERSVRFEFDLEQCEGCEVEGAAGEGRLPRRVLLSWYRSVLVSGLDELPAVLEDDRQATGLRPGQRWRFTVRLRRPHGSVNPHGFDYEAWLLERNLGASGYVRPRTPPQWLGMRNSIMDRVGQARAAVRERFLRVLDADALSADGLAQDDAAFRARRSAAGVLVALAVGDQRAIALTDWTVFNRTGVTHLMSISGLHVTLVSGLAAALVSFGWRRVPQLVLRLPARKAAAVAAMVTAFMYALLAGFAVPAQRTFYMVAVVALALWAGRIAQPSRILALALLAVLLTDPWAVLAAGFWLSFGAVALIFWVTHGRVTLPAREQDSGATAWMQKVLIDWGRTQWAITIGLAPAALLLFGQVSVVGPLANAVAIPLVSGVITPLALLAAALPVDALLHLSAWMVRGLMLILEWCASLPLAVWQQAVPPLWSVLLAVTGVLWVLLPRGVPMRWLGVLLVLPAFTATPPRPLHGEAWITTLDVGQGLAVLVQTREHSLLYDAGPAWAESDSGQRIIAPVLRALGVTRLEKLLVTHNDLDHTGGALSVMAAVQVDEVLTSLPRAHPVMRSAAAARRCRAGERWNLDGVEFALLHPLHVDLERPGVKTNDLSCVLRVQAAGGTAMLLTGDIERITEAALVARDAKSLRAEILLAPHHGSRTSSTQVFLEAVQPQAVVVASGYRNRFGHPRADVLGRYEAIGAAVHRTDLDGAVRVQLGAASGEVQVTRWREAAARYWRHRRE